MVAEALRSRRPMSASSLTKEKALIFRITHVDNLAHVLAEGCHCRSSSNAQGAYVEIGNPELIGKRSAREVPLEPKGTLSDYVPFYFTPYSPMLLNIKTGYSGVPKRPLSEIAILVSSVPKLVEQQVPFVFTDRHAYLKMAQFYQNIEDLSHIAWKHIQARDFKRDEDNLEKFEKYQAEVLVHKHCPVAALLGVICYTDSARVDAQALADKNGATPKIIARPTWYP